MAPRSDCPRSRWSCAGLPGGAGADGARPAGSCVRMPMVGCLVSESLVLLGIVIAGSSGIPGLLAGRTSMIGQYVSTLLAVFGAGIGLGGVGFWWATADSEPIALPWSIPGGEFSVAVDGLSAVFLLPVFL